MMNRLLTSMLDNEERSRTILAAIGAFAGLAAMATAIAASFLL